MPPRLHAFLLLFALCTLHFELSAQYFSYGTDPASVKWKQVKTEHFRVIFPENMEDEGLRVANTLEYYRSPASVSLDANPGRWPVILHNRTIVSNAVTPYAPKRIDMFTMPPQDNYGQDWLDQQVLVTYMACSDRGCRAPVENKSIAIRIPTKGMLQ